MEPPPPPPPPPPPLPPPPDGAVEKKKKTMESLSAFLSRFCEEEEKPSDCVLTVEMIPEVSVVGSFKRLMQRERERKQRLLGLKKDGGQERDEDYVFQGLELFIVKISIHADIVTKKSKYFSEVLNNGETKLEGRDLIVKIKASEEPAFVELVEFMYNGICSLFLKSSELVALLKIAHKFHVASCIKYCSKMLSSSDMSFESAVSCLIVASKVDKFTEIELMADAALDIISRKFTSFHLNKSYCLDLPLSGIKAIFSSNNLTFDSEDAILEFLLIWAKKTYLDPKSVREAMSSTLANFISFRQLSPHCLKWVLECGSFEEEFIYRSAMEVWAFKSQGERLVYKCPISKEIVSRKYIELPITVHQLGTPTGSIMAYFSCSMEKLKKLEKHASLTTQRFDFAGKIFCFVATSCDSSGLSFFYTVKDGDPEFFCLKLAPCKGSTIVPIKFAVSVAVRSQKTRGMFKEVLTSEVETNGEEILHLGSLSPHKRIIDGSSPWYIEDQIFLRVELSVVGIDATQEKHAQKVGANSPLVGEVVQEQRISAATYKDLLAHKSELLDLPISKLKSVLCSDNLESPAEDDVLQLLLQWVKGHFSEDKSQDSQLEVLKSDFGGLIHFAHLSPHCLRWIMECGRFDKEDCIYTLVMEAWAFKSQGLNYCKRHEYRIPKRFIERIYKHVPVVAHYLLHPKHNTEVFFCLSGEACMGLFMARPLPPIITQEFDFCGKCIRVEAYSHLAPNAHPAHGSFSLRIRTLKDNGITTDSIVHMEARSRRNHSLFKKVFITRVRFDGTDAISITDPFRRGWLTLFHSQSDFLIQNKLCLRIEFATF